MHKDPRRSQEASIRKPRFRGYEAPLRKMHVPALEPYIPVAEVSSLHNHCDSEIMPVPFLPYIPTTRESSSRKSHLLPPIGGFVVVVHTVPVVSESGRRQHSEFSSQSQFLNHGFPIRRGTRARISSKLLLGAGSLLAVQPRGSIFEACWQECPQLQVQKRAN